MADIADRINMFNKDPSAPVQPQFENIAPTFSQPIPRSDVAEVVLSKFGLNPLPAAPHHQPFYGNSANYSSNSAVNTVNFDTQQTSLYATDQRVPYVVPNVADSINTSFNQEQSKISAPLQFVTAPIIPSQSFQPAPVLVDDDGWPH